MPKVIQSAPAEVDLLEIWLYIAADSPAAADRLLSSIDDTCRLLARFPKMGRRRDDLSKGLRSLPEGNYVIFYRPIKAGIESPGLITSTARSGAPGQYPSNSPTSSMRLLLTNAISDGLQ
jgi:toxin ParE1/3/4